MWLIQITSVVRLSPSNAPDLSSDVFIISRTSVIITIHLLNLTIKISLMMRSISHTHVPQKKKIGTQRVPAVDRTGFGKKRDPAIATRSCRPRSRRDPTPRRPRRHQPPTPRRRRSTPGHRRSPVISGYNIRAVGG